MRKNVAGSTARALEVGGPTDLSRRPNQFESEWQDQQIRMVAGPCNHFVIHEAGIQDSRLQFPRTGLQARIISEFAVIQTKSSRFRPFDISAIATLQPTGFAPGSLGMPIEPALRQIKRITQWRRELGLLGRSA
jgi:hypothetical protein